jgi:hypothetical protein
LSFPCTSSITKDVATVDHNIPDIDADAELDSLLLWHVSVALGDAPLDIKSASHRVHNAAELSQHSVPGVLDDTSTVLSDLGTDERAQMVLKLGVRSLLVQASQPAVASDIGCEDGCKASLYALGGQGCAPVQGRP